MPRTTNLMHIDRERLDQLFKSWGGYTAVAYKTGKSADCIRNTIRRGSVSRPVAEKIEQVFGVAYDTYKHVEEEQIQARIDLPQTDGKDVKAVLILLREICNNQLAIYKRLNFLTGEVVKLKEKVDTL